MEYLENIKSIVESLLFVSSEPLSATNLSEIVGADETDIRKALKELEAEYGGENKGIKIREVASGYGFYTNPQNIFYIDRLVQASSAHRLTQAALEVLAIISYKQPVTRAEINSIRGVNSETVLNSLMEKGLIREKGRGKVPGMPILYETTRSFLEALGLNDVKDLPDLEQFAPDKESADRIREQLSSSMPNTTSDITP